MKKELTLLCALALAGCTNAYTKFYQPNPSSSPDEVAAYRVSPPPATPMIDHTSLTGEALVKAYAEQGYGILGHSSFNGGGNAPDADAIIQGKKIGADLVVISNPRYTGTRSSVVPLITPTTSTSYTSGSATAYGSGGTATAYGSARTTTYGTSTSYVPISTDRYDFLAVYFVKTRSHLGAFVENLSEAQRHLLQSNHGVTIIGLVNGSPAFDSDMLVGDIILSIDGEVVGDSDSFLRILKDHYGRSTEIKLYRGGQVISKQVSIR